MWEMTVESKDHLEVTIRTAMVIKSLSGLVGARDSLVMQLVMRETIDMLSELNTLVNKLHDAGKRPASTRTSPP